MAEASFIIVNGKRFDFKDDNARTSIGSCTELETDTKHCLVDAINEVNKRLSDHLYSPISISSFSITNPSGGKAELGSTVENISLKWVLNKTPITLTLNGESIEVSDRTATVSGTSATLTATDERDATANSSVSVKFLNGVYYGAAPAPTEINSEFLWTLTKELTTSKTKTFNITVDSEEYLWYAVPTRFGTCSFVVGGFAGGVPLVDTIAFTNPSGYQEDYYVYRSVNPGIGTKRVEVS